MSTLLKKGLTFFALAMIILCVFYVLASIISGSFELSHWNEGAKSWAKGGLPIIIVLAGVYVFSDYD